MTDHPTPEFSRPCDSARLKTPQHVEATPAERIALAKRLDLISVELLEGDVHLMPAKSGMIRVKGTLHARVTQTCVVTLDPVPAELTEDVDVLFTENEADLSVSEDDPEAPELIRNKRIDLGEVLTQTLALSLDPYPRKPDATFTGYEVG